MKKDINSNSAIPREATNDNFNSSYTDQITTIINGIHHYTQIIKAIDKIVPILNSIKLSSDKSYYIILSSSVGMKLMNIVINNINKIYPITNKNADIVSARQIIAFIRVSIDLDDETKAECIKHIADIDEIQVKRMYKIRLICLSVILAIIDCPTWGSPFLFSSDIPYLSTFLHIIYLFIWCFVIFNLSKIIIRFALQLIKSINNT